MSGLLQLLKALAIYKIANVVIYFWGPLRVKVEEYKVSMSLLEIVVKSRINHTLILNLKREGYYFS